MDNSQKVAIIGLGKMGGGFATNLINKGNSLNLYDSNSTAYDRFKTSDKVNLCRSIREAVSNADYVLTSLPTPTIVKEVYLKKDGVLESAKDKCILIDFSTIDSITSSEIEKKALDNGQYFLAVTVGKGPMQAESGESPLFIGGSEETYLKSKILLSDIGRNLYFFGSVEKAIAFKLITNLIGMLNLAVLSEGYALAMECGIDPNVFKNAIDDTGAKSYQKDIRLDMFINYDFSEKFALQYTVKDLGLVNDLARDKSFPLFFGSLGYNIYQKANKMGYGKLDSAAVLKFFLKGD